MTNTMVCQQDVRVIDGQARLFTNGYWRKARLIICRQCGRGWYMLEHKKCKGLCRKCMNKGRNNPMHGRKLPNDGFRKGHRHSEESKKKMSASHKQEFALGRKPWNEGLTTQTDERLKECGAKIATALKGGTASNEAKENMRKFWAGLDPDKRNAWIKKASVGRKGRKMPPEVGERRRGSNNSNWRGGKSFEPYPIGWTRTFKEQIRRRDNYTCQICEVPEAECEKRHHVHHIDYDKKNIKPENLITLCNSCHTKTNFHRNCWEKYFNGE